MQIVYVNVSCIKVYACVIYILNINCEPHWVKIDEKWLGTTDKQMFVFSPTRDLIMLL